ncbi:hypothetical protein [Nostoc sp. MS1]|uniref:PD-(D/E)XK nuclease domain-containing protein n=1 Tax=Nostoc sp. MS1 TaxID=2764711 RepID=UPI001CC383CA|nr:hypothetical protein [Nostoc sp. MS1]BCL34816.1 hypothetical protein NSMS1_12630 [Nostoc sp. MS1]
MLSKERTIEKFNQQIEAIPKLKQQKSFSPEFTKWQRDTQVLIEKIFGERTRHIKDFDKINFSVVVASNLTPPSAFQEAYRDGLDQAQSILQSFIDEVVDYWDDSVAANSRDCLSIIEQICNRFHRVVKQLRSRHENRETLDVKDEYDVQDLLHSLLLLEFDDVRPEEWTPNRAGSNSRMDFLLKKEQTVIEVKKARNRLGAKEVGEQLIIDIERYRTHPDCKILICFVYDPEGQIANPRGLENDLSGNKDGLTVKVIISPIF